MFEGFWLLGRGQFLNYRNVHPYRLRHISFQELGRATISLDGRILPVRKVDKFEVEVQADRLNLIIPAN
jgi:diacylglycerol kinase family enzyme